jgi:hypothetical protein
VNQTYFDSSFDKNFALSYDVNDIYKGSYFLDVGNKLGNVIIYPSDKI